MSRRCNHLLCANSVARGLSAGPKLSYQNTIHPYTIRSRFVTPRFEEGDAANTLVACRGPIGSAGKKVNGREGARTVELTPVPQRGRRGDSKGFSKVETDKALSLSDMGRVSSALHVAERIPRRILPAAAPAPRGGAAPRAGGAAARAASRMLPACPPGKKLRTRGASIRNFVSGSRMGIESPSGFGAVTKLLPFGCPSSLNPAMERPPGGLLNIYPPQEHRFVAAALASITYTNFQAELALGFRGCKSSRSSSPPRNLFERSAPTLATSTLWTLSGHIYHTCLYISTYDQPHGCQRSGPTNHSSHASTWSFFAHSEFDGALRRGRLQAVKGSWEAAQLSGRSAVRDEARKESILRVWVSKSIFYELQEQQQGAHFHPD